MFVTLINQLGGYSMGFRVKAIRLRVDTGLIKSATSVKPIICDVLFYLLIYLFYDSGLMSAFKRKFKSRRRSYNSRTLSFHIISYGHAHMTKGRKRGNSALKEKNIYG